MKNHQRRTRKQNHQREDLAGEHRFGDMGQFILFLLYLLIWVFDSFVLKYTTFFSEEIPIFIKILLGIIILILSGYLARSGLRIVFGEIREKPVVIQKGVFGIVRHPIYLGAILFYLGLLAFSFSFSALTIWLIIIGFYHYLAKHEEKKLLGKFGQSYENYMKDVPMWIPHIK